MSPADHAHRSEELERACDFNGAGAEALLAGDPRRALRLAALGGDQALARRAVTSIVAMLSREEGLRAARDLAARGLGEHAGTLFGDLGAHGDAGEAFAAAGQAGAAAEAFERAGRPADAARALEAALRSRPSDDASRLALGALLARHGRTDAAVKTLQALDPASPERRKALPILRRSLAALGFEESARSLAVEMEALGVADVVVEPVAPDVPAEARPGSPRRLVLGRYETVRELAATPHARVIEAEDRVTGERVAVKLLAGVSAPEGRDALFRFEREARALGEIRHPNVVPLRAYHPEGPAIVLAWMPGGSLAERLDAEPLAPARAVEIACALLGALGEAHRLGILHRDVKPSNVLFDDVGAARLSDFGAAHLGDLSTTATAGAIGTFAYMSPEQRVGRPATIASDVYGVGVLLGHMLTGTPPSAVVDHLEPLPSAAHPDMTRAHDAAIAQLLQEDPRKRPTDAFEARRLLQGLTWPARIWERPRGAPRHVSDRPPAPADARLGTALSTANDALTGDLRRDTWLERDVIVLSASPAILEQARGFARASHPSLPTILRVDPSTSSIWVAPPLGRSLAEERESLSPGLVARLADALAALHASGGAHGSIDAAHIYLFEGDVSLAFPAGAPDEVGPGSATEEARARDRAAIAALA